MKVKCVKCGKAFETKINRIKDGIYEVDYLSCPYCRDIQIITVWTEELKQLQKHVLKVRGKKYLSSRRNLIKAAKDIKDKYIAMIQEREKHENN